MNKKLTLEAGILLLFALLTILHLLPLSLHPSGHANDLQDSLLNAWIVSWVQGALFSQPAHLFDTNIFYPYPNTLSYSEHLFPLAIFSLPIAIVSGSPLFTYNILLIAFFFLNAWAMYLFIKSMTDNRMAGVVTGIIFAFNTYQMQHLAHLQILSSWCIPLAFLHLHRFFKSGKKKEAWLFALFFTIQGLSCIYYGLFFISVLIVVIPVMARLYAWPIHRSFVKTFLFPLAISLLVLFLFSIPYISLFRTFHFQRNLGPGADLMNYFAARQDTILLGELLHPLGSHEHFLFAGFFALLLASFFLAKKRGLCLLIPKIPRLILLTVTGAAGLGFLFLLASGGFTLRLAGLKISGHRLDKYAIPFFLGVIILLVFAFLNYVKKKKSGSPGPEDVNVFFTSVVLVIWSLLLSFGSTITVFGQQAVRGKSVGLLLTPFRWFYAFGFGFKGIRVPSRYAVFVIFGLTIMAGFGFARLWSELPKKKGRVILAALILLFMNLEYLSVPQKMQRAPTRKEIPAAYAYLKTMPGDFAFVEVPFFDSISDDALYMYFSLFHKKKILNGYSGFLPPATLYVREVFKQFPGWECFEILKALHVRYVLLHSNAYKESRKINMQRRMSRVAPEILKEIRSFSYPLAEEFKEMGIFNEDILYEVVAPDVQRPKLIGGRELSPDRWSISCDLNERLLPYLKDKRIDTRWLTPGPKRPGDTLHISFAEPQPVSQVFLSLPPREADTQFAVSIEVKTSPDGKKWRLQRYAYAAGEFVRNLVDDPKNPVQKIYLDGEPIRFMRIAQNGWEKHAPWSIAEMKIMVKTGESEGTFKAEKER